MQHIFRPKSVGFRIWLVVQHSNFFNENKVSNHDFMFFSIFDNDFRRKRVGLNICIHILICVFRMLEMIGNDCQFLSHFVIHIIKLHFRGNKCCWAKVNDWIFVILINEGSICNNTCTSIFKDMWSAFIYVAFASCLGWYWSSIPWLDC